MVATISLKLWFIYLHAFNSYNYFTTQQNYIWHFSFLYICICSSALESISHIRRSILEWLCYILKWMWVVRLSDTHADAMIYLWRRQHAAQAWHNQCCFDSHRNDKTRVRDLQCSQYRTLRIANKVRAV